MRRRAEELGNAAKEARYMIWDRVKVEGVVGSLRQQAPRADAWKLVKSTGRLWQQPDCLPQSAEVA